MASPPDSVIRPDFVCNDDISGGTSQRGPSIATDGAGGFVVAWYEFRDGDADVWFQRFDSAGVPLGHNERLNTDHTMGWQGDPASAVGPDGRFLSSWEDRRDIGNSDVFCQRFDIDGHRTGDNFRVSDSGVPGDQSFSGVHLGPDGTALVAWDDRRNGITGDIFAQMLSPDGTPLGGNFRVNDDAIGRANQYEPAVSGDDSGRFVVAWMDGRGHGGYDWNVFCQRFGPSGNRLGANMQVTTNDSVQWSPGVACAPAGAFAVCWEDERNGDWDVYAQFYDSTGQPTGTNVRVNDDPGHSEQSDACAGASRHGGFLLAWTDCRDERAQVYGQCYSRGGAALGGNFLLSDGASGEQTSAAVAARPDGGYWVCWVDSRNDNDDIYCRPVSRTGQLLGSGFRVNDDSSSSHQRVSSIGMNAAGVSLVAWEDERNGETDIYRCVFDASGQGIGPNVRVNDDGTGSAGQYYAAAAGGKDRFLVTWTDGRNGYLTYGQFFDGSGAAAGPNFVVGPGPAGTHQWYSYCAMDTNNRSAVVWMDTRNGNGYEVFVRFFDGDGNPLGPEFAVSGDTGNQYYASVARNSDGRTLVAWMDYREGPANIYCQLFGADGSPLGGNFRANADLGDAYHGYPACAVADDGRFVVAWEDTRNDRYDVYMQWFDSTGIPSGGNERVNDNITDTDTYSPTCAFDRFGRLAIAFNDERELPGVPQIYCQRFAPDRARISGNQRINEPGLFPKNHHWTVGQSVAAGDEAVAFAWTDNRRHKGWDIFAKLTDWNLVSIAEQPVAAAEDVWIRPTVSSGRFLVECGTEPGTRLLVYDRTGRQALRTTLERGTQELDLSRLSRGVYFCRVESRTGDLQKKLIVR